MRAAPQLLLSVLLTLGLVACDGNKGGDKPAGDQPAGDKPAAGGAATQPAAGGAATQRAAGGAAAAEVPKDARVFWIMPKEGSKVPETFPAAFGVAGMTLTKAGEAMTDKSRGHHHVVVDGKPIPAGTPVPKDDKNIHYGDASSTTMLTLAPGKHTLTLQFADGAHLSYGDALSQTINVEVVKTPAPGKVMFVEPKDGAKVKGPVKMTFGAEGYGIRPAGEDAIEQITGHHHVIVDGAPAPAGVMVPKDETHIHYGKGQTEAELSLAPGKHTLTLQLADGAHLSYGEKLSHTITIEVE
jgi:hypothetical protein